MAKYRSLKPVTYVDAGKVVSKDAGREFELSEDQATGLADSVVLVDVDSGSMFPDGAPIIDPTIVRSVPNTPVVGEAVEPAPKPIPAFKASK